MVEEDEEIERPNKKTKQDRQSLDAQIKTLMEQNRSQKVDSLATLQNSNLTEAVSQAVNYTANCFGAKTNPRVNHQTVRLIRLGKVNRSWGRNFLPNPPRSRTDH